MPFNAQLPSNQPTQQPIPTRRRRTKTTLIEDDSFVVLDQVPLNGTQTFTVTASGRKRYTGNIINDSTSGNIKVQIETTRKRISDWITIKPGDSLDFDRYPLSSMTLMGTNATFTFSGWASGERYGGYVKRISSSISSSSTTISQVEVIDTGGDVLGVFPSVGGAFAMPIRQLTAALDTVTITPPTTGTGGIARLQPWYQPNAKTIGAFYAANLVGPHTLTVRFTYTVPANRIANILSALAFPIRDGTAANPSLVTDQILQGTNAARLVLSEFVNGTIGAAGAQSSNIVGQNTTAFAGDTIVGYTSDGSANGTCTHQLGFSGIEFDA